MNDPKGHEAAHHSVRKLVGVLDLSEVTEPTAAAHSAVTVVAVASTIESEAHVCSFTRLSGPQSLLSPPNERSESTF